MLRALLLSALLLMPIRVLAADCAILLHGILRSSFSMSILAKDVERVGFVAVNHGYPSTSQGVIALADEAIDAAIAECPEGARINFVTHSMGGILVRAYYRDPSRPRPYRVVMLAPPNQGSEVIDNEAFEWFGAIAGQSGASLGTGDDSLPNQLGPVDYPVGIIAGRSTVNPIFSEMIPGEDDGAVAIARTHVEGESDWILIDASHSFIMYNQTARTQVIQFLQTGHFAH